MGKLAIHLQEGFTKDLVIVRLNGEEIYRKPDVNTGLLLGYADYFEVDVKGRACRLEIEVPRRRLSTELSLSITPETQHLQISIEGGSIVYRTTDAPPGYA